jgi:hypothetical protein
MLLLVAFTRWMWFGSTRKRTLTGARKLTERKLTAPQEVKLTERKLTLTQNVGRSGFPSGNELCDSDMFPPLQENLAPQVGSRSIVIRHGATGNSGSSQQTLPPNIMYHNR